jgi:hypothetical protein
VYYERDPADASANDAMTREAEGAGDYGMPVDIVSGEPASLPPNLHDYTGGIFVGLPHDKANAMPGLMHPIPLRVRSDVPPSYQVPHEATHRRYEPPLPVAVNQVAAGFTLVAPPRMGLHYVKVIACSITLDAAGTFKFVQGSTDGTFTADLTGAMNTGGASAPPVLLPPAEISTPWFFTSPDQALGIFTTVGKAQGFVTVCYSPYEA